MIGRFIILCDPEHFDAARDAVVALQEHPNEREIMISVVYGPKDFEVRMFAKRLKKSISVRQVKP